MQTKKNKFNNKKTINKTKTKFKGGKLPKPKPKGKSNSKVKAQGKGKGKGKGKPLTKDKGKNIKDDTKKIFKLDDEEYSRIPIYPNIQYKLNNIFKNNITAFVIAPNITERKRLIKQIIGSYAVNQLSITARFYYISEIRRHIHNKIYKQFIPDMNVTVGDAINKIRDFGYKVFIHGGTIRDIFIHKKPTDIDLVFDKDVQKLKELCDAEKWPCSIIDPRTQYINFGEDKGISLEGDNLKGKFLIPMHNHEVTINDFAYDCQNDIIIDISGHGLEDIVYKKIRISPLPKYWLKWAKSDTIGKKPLRYFKLIQKGFTPRDDNSYEFVVNYVKDNFDSFYMGTIKPKYPVPRIKHFLIVNITQGHIDAETGVYTFGSNENKLIGYLKVIKTHLGKDIFYKIMSLFTDSDLDLFKEEKIVSNIRKVLKNKNVIKAKKELEFKKKK